MKLTAAFALVAAGLFVTGIAAVRIARPHAAPASPAVSSRQVRPRPLRIFLPPLSSARLAALRCR